MSKRKRDAVIGSLHDEEVADPQVIKGLMQQYMQLQKIYDAEKARHELLVRACNELQIHLQDIEKKL